MQSYTRYLKFLAFMFSIIVILSFLGCESKVPKDVIEFMKIDPASVNDSDHSDVVAFDNDDDNRRSRKIRKTKVKKPLPPIEPTDIILPSWLENQQIVQENVASFKYEPMGLLGKLVRLGNDDEILIYTGIYDLKRNNDKPELITIEVPVNKWETTLTAESRFNGGFLINKLNINSNQAIKLSFVESQYSKLQYTIDNDARREVLNKIKDEGLNPSNFRVILGITAIDCLYEEHESEGFQLGVDASWITLGENSYKSRGRLNSYRLLCLDLSPIELTAGDLNSDF